MAFLSQEKGSTECSHLTLVAWGNFRLNYGGILGGCSSRLEALALYLFSLQLARGSARIQPKDNRTSGSKVHLGSVAVGQHSPLLARQSNGCRAGLQISADTPLLVAGPLDLATSLDIQPDLGSRLHSDPLGRLYKAGMDCAGPQLRGL